MAKKKAPDDGLTFHERALLHRLSTECRLARESSATDEGREGGGFVYRLEPSGRLVEPKSARSLILKGKVVPFERGLFGAGDAQQFVPANV